MTRADGVALAARQALNARQRAYLAAILAIDQANEAYERGAWAAGGRRRPAAAWRWIAYNEAGSPLLDRLRAGGLVDAGTGATFEALGQRGLLTRRYCRDAVGLPILEVRLTTAGRAAARTGAPIVAAALEPLGKELDALTEGARQVQDEIVQVWARCRVLRNELATVRRGYDGWPAWTDDARDGLRDLYGV